MHRYCNQRVIDKTVGVKCTHFTVQFTTQFSGIKKDIIKKNMTLHCSIYYSIQWHKKGYHKKEYDISVDNKMRRFATECLFCELMVAKEAALLPSEG